MRITHEEFVLIKEWIYRNARPLDLARWKYQFEGASADMLLEALAFYQNGDGGFGHALEPDSLNPNSSPLQTSTAIERIEEIGGLKSDHPIILGILKYLASGTDFFADRWCLVIPSNNDFPHAPWWNTASDNKERSAYNPTAILVGFILKYAKKDSPLYIRSLVLAKELVESHRKDMLCEMHSLLCLDFLYDRIEEVGLESQAWFDKAKSKLHKDMSDLIVKDLANWNAYACMPTIFIMTPTHVLYADLKEETDSDNQLKISARNSDGIWDISWSWSDYPDAFAISANWWKASLAIRNLMILKNFDLLEGC
jgi:hypothetical protein